MMFFPEEFGFVFQRPRVFHDMNERGLPIRYLSEKIAAIINEKLTCHLMTRQRKNDDNNDPLQSIIARRVNHKMIQSILFVQRTTRLQLL